MTLKAENRSLTRPSKLAVKDFDAYQIRAVTHQCSLPESMLWLAMGLGKTVITLTSIKHLIHARFLRGVLIVAPIRVCRLVWRQEAEKWAHLEGLTFSLVVGSAGERDLALSKKADVYLINYEALGWLAGRLKSLYISKGLPVPFDGVVFDEVTKVKNSTTKRVTNFLKMRKLFKWFTGLTGTPATNGVKDLHGQYLVIDGGKRLGVTKRNFDQSFLTSVSDYKIVSKPGAMDQIKQLIGDITLEMSSAEYSKLPSVIENDVIVSLPDNLRDQYRRLEIAFILELENSENIEVFNTVSMMNKALQFSNGFTYPTVGSPEFLEIHDIKISALEDIIDDLNGEPVLVAYSYKADAARITKHFKAKGKTVINLTECKSNSALEHAMNEWASGNCDILLGHPASMGHGIDRLQYNGHNIVWFGVTWSLDLYDQMNARLNRRGQTKPVMLHRIITIDTFDEIQAAALRDKCTTQDSLKAAIAEYRKAKGL